MLGAGTFPPPSPPAVFRALAYLYQQYSDDESLQAFVYAQNGQAQNYVDTLNDLNLPAYTGDVIAGLLLDWVGAGLYGLARPALTAGSPLSSGPYNTYVYNAPDIPYNGFVLTFPGGFTATTDDVYKRILTWPLYKGDGKLFNVRWLKRRIERFLYGANGASNFPNDTTYRISVTFGTGNNVSIRILTGLVTILGGSIYNFAGTPYNAPGQAYGALQASFVPYEPIALAETFKEAADAGFLELPFQFNFSISLCRGSDLMGAVTSYSGYQLLFSDNALTTLGGPITNTALSLTVASGSGALFPNPSAGQAFVLSLTDALTRLVNEVVLVTAVSGDTFTIVRAQENTTAEAWNAGDIAWNGVTGGQMASMSQIVPLSGNIARYVNASTGSDATGDGSVGNPWQTLQHAYNFVQNAYNLVGFTVTFNCTGAFTAGVTLNGPIVGNTGPASVVFSFASGATVTDTTVDCFQLLYGAQCTIQGTGTAVVLHATSVAGGFGNLIAATYGGSTCYVGAGVNFGAAPSGYHLIVNGGSITTSAAYTISGGAVAHAAQIESGGYISTAQSGSQPITLTGTPAFSQAFIVSEAPGVIVFQFGVVSFSGSATGVRYLYNFGGIINTKGGGGTFFPGSSAGSGTFGQYA